MSSRRSLRRSLPPMNLLISTKVYFCRLLVAEEFREADRCCSCSPHRCCWLGCCCCCCGSDVTGSPMTSSWWKLLHRYLAVCCHGGREARTDPGLWHHHAARQDGLTRKCNHHHHHHVACPEADVADVVVVSVSVSAMQYFNVDRTGLLNVFRAVVLPINRPPSRDGNFVIY